MFGLGKKREIDHLVDTIEDTMLDENSWVEEAQMFEDGSMSLLIGHDDERGGSIVDMNTRKVEHIRSLRRS